MKRARELLEKRKIRQSREGSVTSQERQVDRSQDRIVDKSQEREIE